MEEHLREVDRYKAFLAGERREVTPRGREMARYIEDWERKWERLTGEATPHSRPSDE